MKLSYFELLSPDPVNIYKIGGILSPKLKDISSIGIDTYQYYLSILRMDLKTYFTITGQSGQYDLLSDEDKSEYSLFDLLTANEQSIRLLQTILNFFMKENVVYSCKKHCFLVQDNGNTVGTVTKENYPQLCDFICQRNYIKPVPEDSSKVKSKKASEILKKIQKGRSEKAQKTKPDENMELGNIISAVANKSPSLNILNIWDLTVYQVWDCFSRLSINNIYNIQSMSVAAWGNKENYFDAASWFKRIDINN